MARSRSPDPHLRRNANLQFPPVAARVRRALCHAGSLAGFYSASSLRGDSGLPAARTPVRPRRSGMSTDSNLVRRVGFAVVAIPLALVLVWYGGLPLAAVLAVAGGRGGRARVG